ncbi:SWI/SNF-related matrix-associated actin-dependent regulator of chromatin subfamily A-like protein 1 [Helicoverpa zea]|uniref:SWI/SNF-related matrix-associated actin-dependent regulator of chromatin subfamily A-like protein 1 n=1 Tax=Helicoverpa zea TaxID=7113 RepID=UPI001F5856CF|nr:SWI/SNF-related matrix-associated actin-dependent regulator of chromatin subfamily A-like protein 1 [Helicoverpa zea]XP_047032445.1 SWI/SNF-related matrix-associated actin-dependent regulator of chromatin subfamily A-like protein 1 [Helicoverpa zea]XP_047032446.1 SWI/SNF-related matrix-associated actin-dependent regulator of chromatin subfamily A-like protein 1 [Helicoverpa zea]
MSCSKEEIERKRLAALQKRQQVLSHSSNTNQNTPSKPWPGQISSPQPCSSNGAFKSSMTSNSNRSHPYSKPKTGRSEENNVPVGKVVSGTVYLISEDRFEVNPSEFCAPLINIFKSLPSKSYDAKSKLWNFSVNDYQQLMSKVAPLAPHIVLGPIPPYVLRVLREESMDPSCVDLSPVEATLRNKLMPFQAEGVRFGISRRGRCMIADDMGLGKTFQALAIASYYRHNWPLLIVTTSSMRETWQSKIQELLPSVPMMNIATLTSGKDTQFVADKQTEVVIVSYKITSMYQDLLKSKKFGVVIIDESHYLKSHKAQCTVALSSITRQCSRAVLLSGTPALSRPAELYTQLALIEPGFFSSYTDYGKRYCDGKQTNFGWDMTGQSNLPELQIILQKRFLIRRTKEQVLTSLEEKTRETVLLDSTLLQHTDTDMGLNDMAEAYKSSRASDKHAALITYFSESAKVKIPAICQYIRQLVTDGPAEKFLVFAHHRAVIDAVCTTLDEENLGYISIVGSTPANTRAELVDRFQHSDSCRCAVLSITAANSGLTLTAASLVLFAELHWNPGILTQAESRAHRLGQRGCVRVRYLLAPRTADDLMWPMLQGKLNVLNDVGLSRDTFEHTTMKHQESKNNISQYLTPCTMPKNKNDYIPGTNIRKDSIKSDVTNEQTSEQTNTHTQNGDDVDKSFLDDDEDDELLANLDL